MKQIQLILLMVVAVMVMAVGRSEHKFNEPLYRPFGEDGGQESTSKDTIDWTQVTTARNYADDGDVDLSGVSSWRLVGISKDGDYKIAGIYNGRIYLYMLSDDTWREVQPSGATNKTWIESAVISEDGQTIYVHAYNSYMYKSADGGGTWTIQSMTNDANLTSTTWRGIYANSDCSVVIAISENSSRWMYTTASGVWTILPLRYYGRGCGLSENGSVILLGQIAGTLQLSTDSGANFEATSSLGVDNWVVCDVSADGTKLIAYAFGGKTYMSTNSGADWAEFELSGSSTNRAWASGGGNSDFTAIIGGVNGARLWSYIESTSKEERPAGDFDKSWLAVAVNYNGIHYIAGANGSGLYTGEAH